MTTPDERKRAVDRLLAAPIGTNALSYDRLLSERAELLAAVERMRGALEEIVNLCPATGKSRWAAHSMADIARAALTTGEEK